MSREYKAVLAILAGGSVVMPLVLGLAFGWPTWLWGSLVVVLLIVTEMVGRRHYEQTRLSELYDHQWDGQPERSAYQQRLVPNIRLDSAEADCKFLFSGTVCWFSIHTAAGMSPAYQGDIAVREILARAQRVTATYQPDNHVVVQNELAVALGVREADQPGQVQMIWADNIELTISDEDAEWLRKRSELRKREQLWEHERCFESNVREYLRKEVLESPGSAVVWWLARHTDEIREAVALIQPLAQLVAAANDTDMHEQFQADPAINLVNKTFPDPYNPQRALFADGLAEFMEINGVGHECAESLRAIVERDTSDEPVPVDQPVSSAPAPLPAKLDEFDQQ